MNKKRLETTPAFGADGRRYYSADQYFKNIFGEKVYRISINGGMTCPNRDGTKGTRGCIFCSRGGSGDFAGDAHLSVTEQIEQGKRLIAGKTDCRKFIAYFQAYTNTYAPVDYLKKIFTEAISLPEIAGLSVATRPDCLPPDVLNLLSELNRIKPVWVELGLQTIHEKTARLIRREFSLACFEKALTELDSRSIPIIAHLIFGLPGETISDMEESVSYAAHAPLSGVKLQLLHVLEDTDLADLYRAHPFHLFELEEYCDFIVNCIECLPADMVIHRLTGDGPRKLLIAPQWSTDKKRVLNTIQKKLRERDARQGDCFH